ncbi:MULTISPECIES: amidohydrolase [Mesorhizobium]|uniref:Amidohydrolase n=1 Tax=Mesorhizobium denitrificans TaxID=2294114 RepID=A0A371XCB0_9HYPH|nr:MULTISPECIES: amidohydrolase [Mesorhizobium]RFC66867.1 amidohydrolase [Mesorhizobium denitrificans]
MQQADIIVENARVLTLDPGRPRATAVAIQGGKILAIGDTEAVAGMASTATKRIDAGGATVLPGFIDSHIHIFPGGAQIKSLSLVGLNGFDEIAAAVRKRAAQEPDTKILIAEQAGYFMFGDNEPITRQILDRVLPDRPLAVFASDHHTMWANTAALKAAGILHGREMPPGNEVVMGPDGLATGELREFEGFAPITDLTPTGGREMLGLQGSEPGVPPTAAQRAIDRGIISDGLAYCASLGITSFHNMDGNFYQLELLEEIDRAGGLTVRTRMPFRMMPDRPLSDLEKAVEMRSRWNSDVLRADFVKIFMDGVIESTTAHMFEDYVGMPGVRGSSYFDQAAFDAICIEADRLGLQIAVHAIGDEAVNITLNGYEAAQRANGKRDSRHRIEHIEMLLPADLPRFAKLGVIASMQPTHAPGGYYPPEPILSMVGHQRMMTGYAWQSIRETGARLVFASDWPVAPLDPLLGIKTAMVREPVFDGAPDESQSLADSIAGFTADGAYTEFMEDRKGVLKQGALADLVILSGDIERTRPQDVDALKVQATICAGRITYER